MFGKVQEVPQTETTPFWPRSPYGVAKALRLLGDRQLPRELRPATPVTGFFLTTRVPGGAKPLSPARSPGRWPGLNWGSEEFLYLGNLEAKRDWGYAPEYVEGMWRMLQQD